MQLDDDRRWSAMAEELAGVGYWWMDAASQSIRWSPTMYRIFGFEPGAAPTLEQAMAGVHPEDRAAAEANLARNLAGEGGASDGLRVVWPNGEVRHIEGRNASVRDDTGRVVAVYGALIDVTEHVRVQAELAAARDAAQAGAAVKATFLANMSHELRTPLTSVLGFSALLAACEGVDATARGYVDHIAGASAALLATVNDLLDFSRLEAGQVEIRPRPTDPVAVAREVLGMFTPQAGDKGLGLELRTDGSLPARVLLDPDRLRQILINLVGNAVKFTEAGAVTVSLDYDPAAERLRGSVRDSGPGLTPEQQARLFRRFSQVDGGAPRRQGGTGLGLSICKGLADLMGGDIGVRSRPGAGSTFSFEVAAPPAAVAAPGPAPGAGVEGPPHGARLLVVDDHRANRELVRAILSPWEPEIVEAADGAEAVAAARAGAFDLILMDVRMPGMDGPEAVARIRGRPGPCRAAPILAFSADGDHEALDALTSRGFDGVLAKPVVVGELIAAVARWAAGGASDAPAPRRRRGAAGG